MARMNSICSQQATLWFDFHIHLVFRDILHVVWAPEVFNFLFFFSFFWFLHTISTIDSLVVNLKFIVWARLHAGNEPHEKWLIYLLSILYLFVYLFILPPSDVCTSEQHFFSTSSSSFPFLLAPLFVLCQST